MESRFFVPMSAHLGLPGTVEDGEWGRCQRLVGPGFHMPLKTASGTFGTNNVSRLLLVFSISAPVASNPADSVAMLRTWRLSQSPMIHGLQPARLRNVIDCLPRCLIRPCPAL